MRKYPGVNNGRVEAAINMLGGMNGVGLLLSGKTAVVWKVWKTIKLGTGFQSGDDFCKALKDAGVDITWQADFTLRAPGFTVAGKEVELELVIVSGTDLGFKKHITRADVYKRANELDLDLCPAEVGPQLRLQYKDQIKGTGLMIAMEPIAVSDRFLGVFSVGRLVDGSQHLSASDGRPDDMHHPDHWWVFARRK